VSRCNPVAGAVVFASLIAVGGPVAATDADLGRLFTSPAERARLERLRAGAPEVAQTKGPTTPQTRADVAPEVPVAVSGLVHRSGGRSTVWVNGRPVESGGRSTPVARGEVRVDAPAADGSVALETPEGRRVRVVPGEVYLPGADRVVDLLEPERP